MFSEEVCNQAINTLKDGLEKLPLSIKERMDVVSFMSIINNQRDLAITLMEVQKEVKELKQILSKMESNTFL